MDASAKGKRYPPFEYEVGKEKIREFAQAVGEDNAVYFDRAAAKAAGFRDIPAPPMFAVVYSAGAMGPAILDPEVGIDFARMVHGGQEFVWGEPVCSGDAIATVAECKDGVPCNAPACGVGLPNGQGCSEAGASLAGRRPVTF